MRKITSLIVVIVVAVLVLWDVFVAVTPEEGDTISEIIRDYGSRHPVLPFGFGVLSGHFFWPAKTKLHGVFVGICLGAVGTLLATLGFLYELRWPSMLPVLFGVLLGHLVWAQHPAKHDE